MSYVPVSDSLAESLSGNVAKRADRRRFMRNVGAASVAGLGTLAVSHAAAPIARAQGTLTDTDIFNFALNMEYLGAEYYLRATTGSGLAAADTTGAVGTLGNVTGGRAVGFATEAIRQYAVEFAADELGHTRFLRQTLGANAIARPAINFTDAFNQAAAAAGLPTPFDPFANENNFLLGAFLFEDVCVTALKGSAALITDKALLEAAAGFLAVEGYQAATIRSVLFARGLSDAVQRISDARDSLDGADNRDQSILRRNQGVANIVPADRFGIAFSRTPAQVLNIAYLSPNAVSQGGFFPQGVNGTIKTSGGNPVGG